MKPKHVRDIRIHLLLSLLLTQFSETGNAANLSKVLISF